MHLCTAAITALTVMLIAACAHRPATDAWNAQQELRQTQGAFLDALSARNVQQATRHFADDAVLHVANLPPMHSRESIQQFYGNVFRFLRASTSTPETTRFSGGADMAYTAGRIVNVFDGEQGPVEFAGKFILVWERRDDRWSIAAYSISSNRPDAGR